ncbi:MAG: hypothetical protein HKN09_01655 [Saprospiraceae bacterium]|nr:hypothetical protein [Saprospiraceae bacterium]
MKKKIVLWGLDENENKILIGLELLAQENKVHVFTFPEEIATEIFYNKLMDEWRLDKEVEFPVGHTKIERPLSVTDDLLPETIKVQRTDLITRAKAEWHFVVLSSKLYDLYGSELDELKQRINNMKSYDNAIWEEMKGFWSKVQNQIFEKNLFKEHGDKLKEQTNYLFDKLKQLRTTANEELDKISKENVKGFVERIDAVIAKVEQGLGLNPLFEDLKKMQGEFKQAEFTRSDRSKVWKRIDEAFKLVKEKKYGKASSTGGNTSRLERRYQGLLSAIEKMERSIARDQKDIDYQDRKVHASDGQLEMQIRQAKIKMIQERMKSKNEKLKEMLATKKDLEARLAKEKERMEKDAQRKEIKKRKEEVKEKIATEIKEQAETLDAAKDKLENAAEAINKEKTKGGAKSSVISDAIEAVGEAVEDAIDTVKAVTEVVGDNVEAKVDELREDHQIDEKLSKVKDKVEETMEKVGDKIEEVIEKVTDKVKDSAGEEE